MILVRWCIPDMPRKLRDQIRREAYLTNEIIIRQEMLRARGMVDSDDGYNFLNSEGDLVMGENGEGVRKRHNDKESLV